MGGDTGNIHTLGLRALGDKLRAGKLSSAEICAAFRQRARERDSLNAFLRVYEDGDNNTNGGDNSNNIANTDATPLAGLPIAHKDIFCAKNELATCGSRMLQNFTAPYDSTVVEKLRGAGMVTIGRANMDEFAMGSSGEHSAFAPTKNPWDSARVPGGSSSGSAAAVAARLTPAATATDTGGSIRQPAAFCGVTGIKPTYGRVSRYGMVAFASSFDVGGVIAQSAEDCALALSAMAGFDERDSTSLNHPAENFAQALAQAQSTAQSTKPLSNKVIGIPQEFFGDGLSNGVATCVQAAASELEKQGATLKTVSLESVKHAIAAYYVLTSAEASSNLSRYDGIHYGYRAKVDANADLTELYEQTRAQGFGEETKRRILIGTYMLSYGYYDAYYRRAMKVRAVIAREFSELFKQCDALLGPTTPDVAFKLGAIGSNDPVSMYLQDVYTAPVNLAGLPALSMPCGFSEEMPVGAQLIGAALSEGNLLNIAHCYQQATDFHRRIPPQFAE